MALLQLGSLFANLKGSIGGTTFSRNHAGVVAKSRLQGKKSMSSRQSLALSVSAQLTNLWTTLPTFLKLDWNTLAATYPYTDRFGIVKPLTGFQYFKMLASNNYFAGGSIAVDEFTYISPPALPSYTVTLTDSDIVITFSTPIDLTTTRLLLYASKPTKSLAKTNRGAYIYLPLVGLDYSSSFSIKTRWESVTGLNWASIANSGHFLINVILVPVQFTTGLSGLAVTANGSI